MPWTPHGDDIVIGHGALIPPCNNLRIVKPKKEECASDTSCVQVKKEEDAFGMFRVRVKEEADTPPPSQKKVRQEWQAPQEYATRQLSSCRRWTA
jgi:hypothetical protein